MSQSTSTTSHSKMTEKDLVLGEALTARLPLNPLARANAVMDRLDAVGAETGIAVDVVGVLDLYRDRTLRVAREALVEAQEQGANLVVIMPRGKYRVSNVERSGE
jgi:hypothetical protein